MSKNFTLKNRIGLEFKNHLSLLQIKSLKMEIAKVFIVTLVLIGFVFAGLAIKLILNKNARFTAGSCSGSKELGKKGIECSCGGNKCENFPEK